MKLKINFIIAILLIAFICNSCILIPKENRIFIEPKLISINRNLTFSFGADWDTLYAQSPDYRPIPIITLDPYKIGKFELSNEEYEKFVIDGGYEDSTYWSEDGWEYKIAENWTLPLYWDEESHFEADTLSILKDMPVHGITYYEAEAYCNWLSEKTNKNYHIPTSQQWVRAAKGPDPGRKYPWGSEFTEEYSHYIVWDKPPLTFVNDHPEGRSYDGCYQMVGNVYEMTYTDTSYCYIQSYYYPTTSTPGLMKEQMTTTGCWILAKYSRRFGMGLRICRSSN